MTGGRAMLVLVALAALQVAGCGAVAYTRAADHRVALRLDEYRITPEHIRVDAGRVTFVARDTGKLTHNLKVVAFKRPKSGEEEHQFGTTMKTLFPGQSASITVNLAPGKYRLICTIANHDNLGQWAELKVAG